MKEGDIFHIDAYSDELWIEDYHVRVCSDVEILEVPTSKNAKKVYVRIACIDGDINVCTYINKKYIKDSSKTIYAVKFFDDDGCFNMNNSNPIFYYNKLSNARAKLMEGYTECVKWLLDAKEEFVSNSDKDFYDIEVDGLVVHSCSISTIELED